MVNLLLEVGADMDYVDIDGCSAFVWAATRGHLEVMRTLFDFSKNVDLNKALLEASRKGHVEVVRFLVEGGADLNAFDEYGWTPLMEATREGHLDVVKFLVRAGADCGIEDVNGTSLFDIAVGREREDVSAFLLPFQ
jgi:ankyrin repeat protein